MSVLRFHGYLAFVPCGELRRYALPLRADEHGDMAVPSSAVFTELCRFARRV